MSEKLSDRLDDVWRTLYGDGDEHGVCDTIAEAADALRAVEGAVAYEVEACKFEVAPEEFDLRGSISCAASFIGQRVALVPLDAAGSAEGGSDADG